MSVCAYAKIIIREREDEGKEQKEVTVQKHASLDCHAVTQPHMHIYKIIYPGSKKEEEEEEKGWWW